MKPVKSSLRLSPLRCAKRTHITTQMKRVQRANGSLAQVWGRAAPNGLPAENTTKPIWSRKNALCRAADSVLRSLRSPCSPVPFVLRRDRHKETHKPEVNPQSPITAPTIRERTNGDHDPRRNRNGTSRKPFCLAHRRQTAGVIEHRTFRQERMTDMNRTQDISRETYDRHETNEKHSDRTA